MRFHRPSHGTIVAYTALAVALGGTSYAAVNVTGQQVKDSSLTGRDVKNGSLTGNDIKKRSVPIDRLSGALPTGPMGPAGPAGAQGGPATTKFFDQAAGHRRVLAQNAEAT